MMREDDGPCDPVAEVQGDAVLEAALFYKELAVIALIAILVFVRGLVL